MNYSLEEKKKIWFWIGLYDVRYSIINCISNIWWSWGRCLFYDAKK